MNGDSPRDYMSAEEKAKWDRDLEAKAKLRAGKRTKQWLRDLCTYTDAHLRAELYRREHGIDFHRKPKQIGEGI